jgi:hypothetical protein
MARVAALPAVALILDFDPDLGSGILKEDWALARSACTGELLGVPSGAVQVPSRVGGRDDLFGFVIVEGLICRASAPPGPGWAARFD